MTDRKPDDGMGAAGLIGAGMALAVCCLAPLAAVFIGTAAISAWLGWLGYGGLASIVLALGFLAYGLWHLKRRGAAGASRARGHSVEL